MKIIDLLNKIANGEAVPKEIKTCDNDIFYYDETDENEIERYKNKNDVSIIDEFYLNDEVEIIEEDKEIEKMNIIYDGETNHYFIRTNENLKCWITTTEKELINKTNEIIDKIKSLEKNQ
ncbi:MAG: hypothetical protein IJ568_05405 [Bacilli bacterium]|nr:hypothetical protein [Bacilli bacterium]